MLTSYTPPVTPSDPNPSAHPTRYDYDANDHLYHITDPRGNVTTLSHNWIGQLTLVQHPDGTMRSWAYNDDGTLNTFNDENNHATTYTYDLFKRVLSVTTAQRFTGDTTPRTTYFYYHHLGWAQDDYSYTDSQVRRLVLPSGKVTLTVYDENFRKISVTPGAGTGDAATTNFEYDAVGNLTKVTEPNGQTGGINAGTHWDYTYDERNRLITVDDPTKTNHNSLGKTVNSTYDQASNKKTERRANDQLTTYNSYDQMNRVTQMTVNQKAGLDAITNYTWWPNGSMHTMQDPRTNTYTYDYDPLNRLTKTTYPGGSTETKTYDIAGNLYQFKNRAGNIQTFAYDNRNRETSYGWDDGVTPSRNLVYDNASNITACNSTAVGMNLFYYNDNLLKSQEEWTGYYGDTANHRIVSYTYDEEGDRATVHYPSGITFGYHYTGRKQLDQVFNNASPSPPWVQYTYDGDGNRKTRNLYYGANTSYGQADALNQIHWVVHTFSDGRTARFDYDFGKTGLLAYERRDSGGGDRYDYDLADQSKDFIRDGTWNGSGIVGTVNNTQTSTYDANGNRTTVVNPGGGSTSYTPNLLNQYSAITGVPVPTYDANGNLKTYNGWTYTYDAMNRLTIASGPGSSAYFYYDGLNRQIVRNITGVGVIFSVWDGWNLVEEYRPGPVIEASYTYGAGAEIVRRRLGSSANLWYHQDGRGNTSHASDDTGHMIEHYTYDLYGKPTIFDALNNQLSTSNYNVSHLFTGQRWLPQVGPSGMYDYRNRFMFPEIGRFLQPDPVGFGGDASNLYRYCGNNAANADDPTGLGNKLDGGDSDGTQKYTPTGSHIPLPAGASVFSAFNFPSGFSSTNGWGSVSGRPGASGPSIPVRKATDLNGRYADGSLPFGSTPLGRIVTTIATDVEAFGAGLVGDLVGVLQIPIRVTGGVVSHNVNEVIGAFTSALTPKYGYYAGPGWGLETAGAAGIAPFDNPIDRAAFVHDESYAAARVGIGPGSPGYNDALRAADVQLIQGAYSGPVGIFGAIYRAGLNSLFTTKIVLTPPG